MKKRSIWLFFFVAALTAACLGVALVGLLTLAGDYVSMSTWLGEVTDPTALVETAAPLLTATATSSPTLAPSPTPSITPTITPVATPDDETQAHMTRIEEQVVNLRGLQPVSPVAPNLLTTEDLHQRVIDDFFFDYSEEEATFDALVLSVFGLLDSEFNLRNFYLDLYSEQVAGYYDDEVKQMYVVQDVGFHGPERLTYAHEYVHALQDQVFNFETGLNYTDDDCEADNERCAGIQALIEGDATLLEEQWLLTFATTEERIEIIEFYDSYDSPVYNTAPEFMKQDFTFPYTFGAEFVRRIHSSGGWAAVDAIYTDPPRSTEQILHPDRYPEDQPVTMEKPEVLDALGDGWVETETNVLGEWYTRLMLSEYLDVNQAIQAAEGWGGDIYSVFFNESSGESALVMIHTWDTLADVDQYSASFLEYAGNRFGAPTSLAEATSWTTTENFVSFELGGLQSLWILAPDETIAGQLRQAFDFPVPIE
jgi:hypothetical protein